MAPVGRDRFETLVVDVARLEERQAAQAQAAKQLATETELRRQELTRIADSYVDERQHDQLIASIDKLSARIDGLDRWRANLLGRTVGIAFIGAALVAAVAALISHLAS